MRLARLLKDRRGVGSIEYALVASLIAIGAISGYANLGSSVETLYVNTIQTNLQAHL